MKESKQKSKQLDSNLNHVIECEEVNESSSKESVTESEIEEEKHEKDIEYYRSKLELDYQQTTSAIRERPQSKSEELESNKASLLTICRKSTSL